MYRRFWFTHVTDVDTEIKAGANLHVAILRAILGRDADATEAAAWDLNDYLIDFSYATLSPGAGAGERVRRTRLRPVGSIGEPWRKFLRGLTRCGS